MLFIGYLINWVDFLFNLTFAQHEDWLKRAILLVVKHIKLMLVVFHVLFNQCLVVSLLLIMSLFNLRFIFYWSFWGNRSLKRIQFWFFNFYCLIHIFRFERA